MQNQNSLLSTCLPSSWRQLQFLIVIFITTLAISCAEEQEVIPKEDREAQSAIELSEKNITNARVAKLSVNKVTAKSHDGNVPQNTIDGKLSTRWSANGSGQYITYDLGSSKDVSSLKVAWYKGNQRRTRFKIRVGNSTSSLSTVYSAWSSGNTNSLETYNFNTVKARYVRITGFGNTQNTWNSITETEIYGESSGDDGGGGSYPYDILGLRNWKLNGFSGSRSNATYVDQIPNLPTYTNSNWFYTDGTWVFFRTFVGSPTSSGSGNPRTELREMVADGSRVIYWDGTGSKVHKMQWKVRVDRLPSSGKICFGQIHDKTDFYDDVIRVQFEGSPNQTSGSVKMKIMGWVTEKNGDRKGDFVGSGWQVGQEMNLELTFGNKKVVLNRINSNGSRSQLYSFNGANAKQNYFKAGSYLQSVKGKSFSNNDYGVVAIKSLSVSH